MTKAVLGFLAVCLSAGYAYAVQTRTFEGRVTDIRGDKLTLEVAGEKIDLKGDPSMFGQVKKGQTVSVQAKPDLEAAEVEPIRGSFAGKQLVGRVQQIGQNSAKIQTLDGQEETVKLNSDLSKKLAVGDQVVIALKEDPNRAKSWRATQVGPVPAQQHGQPAPKTM